MDCTHGAMTGHSFGKHEISTFDLFVMFETNKVKLCVLVSSSHDISTAAYTGDLMQYFIHSTLLGWWASRIDYNHNLHSEQNKMTNTPHTGLLHDDRCMLLSKLNKKLSLSCLSLTGNGFRIQSSGKFSQTFFQ